MWMVHAVGGMREQRRSAGRGQQAVKQEDLVPVGENDLKWAGEWALHRGEQPVVAGGGDVEAGMSVGGRGGDCFLCWQIGGGQSDQESVLPRRGGTR
jgi:hypothetical protein